MPQIGWFQFGRMGTDYYVVHIPHSGKRKLNEPR